MSPVQFGIQIEPQYGFTYDEIRDIAISAEKLGLESVWVSDHFFMTSDSIGIPCLECWTLLSALAIETNKIRLGSMVSAQSYRSPALLAKISTTLDNLSAGRLNFGIGAGWKEVEYRAYGYRFPKAYVRIKQLEEAIKIVKLMWTEAKPSFEGKYYKVNEALCYPKPTGETRIPLWVGGMGNYTLKIAAKHADAVNFVWTQPKDLIEDRLDFLKKHCLKYGRNYDEIRKSVGIMMTLGENEEELEKKKEKQIRMKNTPYMRYLSSQPPNLVGIPEEIADKILEYSSLGIDHFLLRFHYGEEIESLNLFIEKVKKLI
jgi:F420-dependent oxidoreductase-like protein